MTILKLEDYKDFVGITNTTDDSMLKTILAGVEDYMLGYTGITLDLAGGVLFEQGESIFLDTPNYSHDDILVEYVAVGGVDGEFTEMESSMYVVSKYDEIVILPAGESLIDPTAYYPIRVSVTNVETTYPESIVLACFELTKHWKSNGFVQSKTQQGQSLAQFNTGKEMPPHILAIFNKYRIL